MSTLRALRAIPGSLTIRPVLAPSCRSFCTSRAPGSISASVPSHRGEFKVATRSHFRGNRRRIGAFGQKRGLAMPVDTKKEEIYGQRLSKLRQFMKDAEGSKGVDAYIIPTEDPHMSEYPADCYKRRDFLAPFTGSAGTLVVTASEARLWTDGRYFLQASEELTRDWTLMRAGTPGCPDIEDWLAETLPSGGRVGLDPFCHTADSVKKLRTKLEAAGKSVVSVATNLVDLVWGQQRPGLPTPPLRVHDIKWAGQTVTDKLKEMRTALQEKGADALLVTMVDEVCWLYNIRGSDVPYNPVCVSYALVTRDGANLYLAPGKIPNEVARHLEEAQVVVRGYGEVLEDVKALAEEGKVMWLDPSKVSQGIYDIARAAGGEKLKVVEAPSPVALAKALKNPVELAGMREAHLRDAVAICEFFLWLEQQMEAGRTLTEVDIDHELTARRTKQEGFKDLSFPTIAGSGPNGAIMHYRAQEETCRTLAKGGILLLDSGCQYECGTTDITRNYHFGTPTDHYKRCYTRVLQGHIALDLAVFPEGTPGCALDTLARGFLWKEGLNFRHGTGHGVGAALNVHEGPQSISPRFYNTTPLQASMICSNEPGYYEDGSFGIRIENLVVVKEADTPFRFGGQSYFGFERLTLVPIEVRMLDLDLMSEAEIQWLDQYHEQVWSEVSVRLHGEVKEWLRAKTRPVREQLEVQASRSTLVAAQAS